MAPFSFPVKTKKSKCFSVSNQSLISIIFYNLIKSTSWAVFALTGHVMHKRPAFDFTRAPVLALIARATGDFVVVGAGLKYVSGAMGAVEQLSVAVD